MDTLERGCAKPKAHMNKHKKTELAATVTTVPAPQTKRYDEAFKQAAVENWTGESERERTDAGLLTKIRAVHEQHQGRYGAPRI